MKRYITPISIIFVFGVLLWLGFNDFPWISDDITYRLPFREYFVEGKAFSFTTLWDSLVWRYLHDNGRIANLAMYALMCLPASLLALLSACIFGVTIIIGLKITGLKNNTRAAAILSAAYVLVLPWVDQMYVFNYQLNYLWGAALMLAGAWCFLCQKHTWWLFPAFLIIGAWNEATSLPLFISICAAMLFYKQFRSRQSLIMVSALLIGLAWLFLVPGAREYRGQNGAIFSMRMNILAIFALPALVYATACAILYFKTRSLEAYHFILLIIALSSAAVMLLIPAGPRIGTASVLAAAVGVTAMICKDNTLWPKVLAFVVTAIACTHLIFVDIYAKRERSAYDSIAAQILADTQHTIYGDFTLRENAPLICLQKPYFDTFAHYSNVDRISLFYNGSGHLAHVVPSALRNFDPTDATPIGSDGFMEYKGLIIGPITSNGPAIIWLKADGTSTEFFTTPFTPNYAWYHPNRASLSSISPHTPKSISRHISQLPYSQNF